MWVCVCVCTRVHKTVGYTAGNLQKEIHWKDIEGRESKDNIKKNLPADPLSYIVSIPKSLGYRNIEFKAYHWYDFNLNLGNKISILIFKLEISAMVIGNSC